MRQEEVVKIIQVTFGLPQNNLPYKTHEWKT